jgi:SAM-dependent methyltransferase
MITFKNTRTLVAYLRKYINGKTVDFGAGNAKYRNLIKPCTSEYIAFDMVPGEHIDVVGDALNPPFQDETFDTVLSTQTLEHVEKPWVVVQEIKRILKPDGVCIITAPFLIPYHADPYDFFRYTKQGLESLFKNEGFEIIESGTYGNTPSVLVEMMHFSHFSHYTTRSKWRGRIRNTFIRSTKWLAYKLDTVFKNKSVYANSYVVARKVHS